LCADATGTPEKIIGLYLSHAPKIFLHFVGIFFAEAPKYTGCRKVSRTCRKNAHKHGANLCTDATGTPEK